MLVIKLTLYRGGGGGGACSQGVSLVMWRVRDSKGVSLVMKRVRDRGLQTHVRRTVVAF